MKRSFFVFEDQVYDWGRFQKNLPAHTYQNYPQVTPPEGRGMQKVRIYESARIDFYHILSLIKCFATVVSLAPAITCDDELDDEFEMQGRIQGFLKGVHMINLY